MFGTLGVKQERQNFFSILSVVLSFINTSKGEFHRFPCAPLQSTPSLPEEAIGMSAFPLLLFSGMLYKWSPFKAGFSLSIMLLRSIQLFIDTSFFLFPNSIPLYGLNLFVHQLEGCLICFWWLGMKLLYSHSTHGFLCERVFVALGYLGAGLLCQRVFNFLTAKPYQSDLTIL